MDKTVDSVLRKEELRPATAAEAGEIDEDCFQVLGYNLGSYFYLPRGSRQVVELRGEQHTKLKLLTLAPMAYWERAFPGRSGPSWDLAANSLIRGCERAGVYDTARIRGRGAWWDEDGAVLHLGDRLVIGGISTPIMEAKPGRYIYEASSPMSVETARPLSFKEANEIVKICERISWDRPISARLLAGFITLAPVCGALPWRPHIWITGPAGSGKAQPHSARVLTPRGWSTMGELRVGDYVRTPDNGYGCVRKKYPQGVVPIYRLTFSDGRTTRATADHLWKVRIEDHWRLKTTLEMIEILGRDTRSSTKLAIPLGSAVVIESNRKTKLPIHPYVLGAFLGDGHMASVGTGHAVSIRLTSYDSFIVDKVRSLLPNFMGLFKTHDPHDFRLGDLSRYGRRTRNLIKDLRLLGTRSHNKFIPEQYLCASIKDRFELLRGLMDTDGTASRLGGSSYCTVSPILAENVAYLVRSLGGVALISDKMKSS